MLTESLWLDGGRANVVDEFGLTQRINGLKEINVQISLTIILLLYIFSNKV